MTVVDEGFLRRALGEAGDAIEVPQAAVPRILAVARPPEPEEGEEHQAVQASAPDHRRRRVIQIAAAVVVVLAGTGLALAAKGDHRTTGEAAGANAGGHSGATYALPPEGKSAAPNSAAAAAPSPGVNGAGGTPGATGSGAQSSPATVAPLPTGAVGQSAKVETTGSVALSIAHGTLQEVSNKLAGFATGDGGFVASSQVQVGSGTASGSSQGTTTLQVPQPAFETLLTQVESVGTVQSASSTSTDVTGQYVDLQSRITALEASRQQYLTIMSKASSIGDILSVQSQLDAIQSQIEQLQGQLNLLTSQTTYATLSVSLSEAGEHPVVPPPAPSSLSSAWHASVSGFVTGVDGLIRFAGPTLLIVLVLAGVVFVGRWARRTYRRRML